MDDCKLNIFQIILAVIIAIAIVLPIEICALEVDSDGYPATNVVMLGDSITRGLDWNHWLGREDISNQGLSGESTTDFLNRMDEVYKLRPKLCFVMGGINDFNNQHSSPKQVFNRLKTIVNRLQSHGIKPVVESTLYVTPAEDIELIGIDNKVFTLNKLLSAYCLRHHIEYIDLNQRLAIERYLIPTYSYDGTHPNMKAYEVWLEAVARELLKEKV